jgi:hypothetical protein
MFCMLVTLDNFYVTVYSYKLIRKSKVQNARIIGFIKKQRLNWLGHVERMSEDNIVQRIKR